MIIDTITIRNFGIYQDPDPINLRTTRKQPIILFGGLNGGGKTTLLDAILLCLYGPLAITSNRGKKGYHTYLRDSLNRHTKENEAHISLTFRHHRDGNEDTFQVNRSWVCDKTVKETLKVTINNQEDSLIQEHWLDFIDELIPAQVANLFFFDGEKIEQFADLDNARQLLESALHSLLGLDVLNQLHQDLGTLEQRKKTALRTTTEQQEIKEKQKELEQQQDDVKRLTHELAGSKTDLQQVESKLKAASRVYKRKGGDLYEQRELLFAEKAKLKRKQQEASELFVQEAATETPLKIVEELLNQVVEQADKEQQAKQAELISGMLTDRDQQTLKTVHELVGKEATAALKNQLDADRKKYQQAASIEQYINLSSDGLKQLHKAHHTLPSAKKSFATVTQSMANLEEQLERLDSKIQSIPDTDTIQRFRTEVERWEKEDQRLMAQIAIHEESLRMKRNKVEMIQASLFTRLESDLTTKFKREDDQRIIDYSTKARGTLLTLKQRVINSRLAEIENLILQSFKKLIRKSNLIGAVQISSEDYSLSLFDDKQYEIHPSRLSAGERQLLAIAILWGLAKAAGLPLPVVIDTPLGRLDGEHRNKLLTAYFPKASHQVIILSTDTEIAKQYYAQLKPFIKRSYQIDYNPAKQASEISEGYQFA